MSFNKITHSALILLFYGTAFADNSIMPTSILIKNKIEETSLQYWTPERFAHAKSLPAVTFTLKKPSKKIKEISISKSGKPPAAFNKPRHVQLYTVKKNNLLTGENQLTTKIMSAVPFSSTRIIPAYSTEYYPYSTVGKLFFTTPNKEDYFCSATVIEYRIVLTAAHCIFTSTNGAADFNTNFVFVPGYEEGAEDLGLWYVNIAGVTRLWLQNGGINPNPADYGLLEMKDNIYGGISQRVGDVTGFLGHKTNALQPNHAHLLGYPCNFDQCEQMHQVTSQNGPTVQDNNVEYGSDMREGSDGGPWVQNFGLHSVNEEMGLNPELNAVIGVTSYFYPNATINLEGSSNLDNQFEVFFENFCAFKTGNCS